MKVYKEVNYAWDFEFWSGGKDTANDLTDHEIGIIFDLIDDMYPDGCSETDVNDIFWFERDWIAEALGYSDYDELLKDRES